MDGNTDARMAVMKEKTLKISTKHIGWTILSLKVLLISYFVYGILQGGETTFSFDTMFFIFLGVGFCAQLIDGALGMAYGVSSSSMLLYFGVSPKVASASVHLAEVFTTGVSGLSHLKFKNLDIKLFLKLVVPGVIGAVLGAYLLSKIFDGALVKPYIAAYLLILGVLILYKGLANKQNKERKIKRVGVLAFMGGMFDAIGGGGWGPIVTSNILNSGKSPRHTIGTVNTAEFFVTFFATAVFLYHVGVESWQVVLGLILGGVLAAPLGAFMAARINKRLLLIMVGLVIVITSLFTISKTFF